MPNEEEGAEDEGAPGPHPEPPADLHERRPSITRSAGPWWRLSPADLDPLYFARGPAKSGRFGAPDGEYGVLYIAEDEFGAFVESFGYDTGIRTVDETDLLNRGLAKVEAREEFGLIDLTGEGLARMGADARLVSGDHGVARRWSAALREHPARPDGLRYPCRHDPSRAAVALYDHVSYGVSATALGTMLDAPNRTTLSEILRTYSFGLT